MSDTATDITLIFIQRPAILMRSLPSTQITTCTVHACKSSHKSNSKTNGKPSPEVVSRTQYKLLLQRHSFLADDKNHLDHPDNMRRLTKELDRMNREYRYVKQYQDPFILSLNRVKALQEQQFIPANQSTIRSPHTSIKQTHDECRRHSFPSVTNKLSSSPQRFIYRMFGNKSTHHSPLASF